MRKGDSVVYIPKESTFNQTKSIHMVIGCLNDLDGTPKVLIKNSLGYLLLVEEKYLTLSEPNPTYFTLPRKHA